MLFLVLWQFLMQQVKNREISTLGRTSVSTERQAQCSYHPSFTKLHSQYKTKQSHTNKQKKNLPPPRSLQCREKYKHLYPFTGSLVCHACLMSIAFSHLFFSWQAFSLFCKKIFFSFSFNYYLITRKIQEGINPSICRKSTV